MNYEERNRAFLNRMRQKADEEKARDEAERQAEMKKAGIVEQQQQKPQFDHPDSLENDEATILYVVAMAVSTIFKGNWILWIIWTIIWWKYINRHK